MKMMVTQLRERGRVLRRSELPAPIEGNLLIDDFPPHADKDRWKRRARLAATEVYGSVHPNLIQPIFDVQLMKIDEGAMYLQGMERHTDDGGATLIEVVQVWMCVTAAGTEP